MTGKAFYDYLCFADVCLICLLLLFVMVSVCLRVQRITRKTTDTFCLAEFKMLKKQKIGNLKMLRSLNCRHKIDFIHFHGLSLLIKT